METMKKDSSRKWDKLFIILIITSSVIVVSANIVVNFFN